ncbi:hypothetical protein [Bermanella sp. R86510]|uniref:hypothetical protein n=1 Tax=unclassified Bermanella TaxID=2627862 RepID=UPI0037C63FC9
MNQSDKQEMSTLQEQSIHLMNSLLAASDPKSYGILVAVISPYSLGGGYPEYREHSDIIFFGGFLSVGLYNSVELEKDKYSKKDVFIRNMIIWNALMEGMKLLEIDNETIPSGLSLNPMNEGLKISYDIKF